MLFFKKRSVVVNQANLSSAEETKSVPETTTLSDPAPWAFDLFAAGLTNDSGIVITPENAMGSPAVRCAILAISQGVGQFPLALYQRGENNARDVARNHPIFPLIQRLATEKDAITRLAAGIEQCRKTDEGSRLLLERILAEEEEHADWLETQLELIRQLGEGLYLNTQVNG